MFTVRNINISGAMPHLSVRRASRQRAVCKVRHKTFACPRLTASYPDTKNRNMFSSRAFSRDVSIKSATDTKDYSSKLRVG